MRRLSAISAASGFVYRAWNWWLTGLTRRCDGSTWKRRFGGMGLHKYQDLQGSETREPCILKLTSQTSQLRRVYINPSIRGSVVRASIHPSVYIYIYIYIYMYGLRSIPPVPFDTLARKGFRRMLQYLGFGAYKVVGLGLGIRYI